MSMEIPDGWKREYEYQQGLLKNPVHLEYDSKPINRRLDQLNLMKEMAEALDYCTEYYKEMGEPHTDSELSRKRVAAEVLKKFKEWK